MINRSFYENRWKKRFKEINKRKPNHLEVISFCVGLSAGMDFKEELLKEEKK